MGADHDFHDTLTNDYNNKGTQAEYYDDSPVLDWKEIGYYAGALFIYDIALKRRDTFKSLMANKLISQELCHEYMDLDYTVSPYDTADWALRMLDFFDTYNIW